MINAQSVGAGKRAGHSLVDSEWKRDAQAFDAKPVFAWCFEIGEIRLQNLLISGIGKSLVRARAQRPQEHFLPGVRVKNLKLRRAGRPGVHLAEAAKVIAHHRLLGEARQVARLIDMQNGAPAQGIIGGRESHVGRPKIVSGVRHCHDKVFTDGLRQF